MIKIDEKLYRICIINVYFGSLPNYFSLWLKSAAKNPNIDFLIFGDPLIYHNKIPNNVKMIKTSLAQIKLKASQELDMQAVLDSPYKLCDYKVLYGLIFKEYLSNYDYWGHCDLDLIWGNLEKFFIENRICDYDKFLPLGHLSLYRNTKDVNSRIMNSGGKLMYKDIYSTNEICRADEIWGIIPIYLNNNYSFFSKKIFADILVAHKRYTLATTSFSNDDIIMNHKHQVFHWENGTLLLSFIDGGKIQSKEYAYIHFQQRPDYTVCFNVVDTDSFFITSNGFIQKKKELTARIIKKYGGYRGFLVEWFEIHKNDFRYWIKERIDIYFKK